MTAMVIIAIAGIFAPEPSFDCDFSKIDAADVTSTGEMSRFMLQMLVESGHDIERLALSLPQEAGSTTCQDENKTNEVMERLHRRFDKQRNPERRFYHNGICGRGTEDGFLFQ